MVLLILLGNKMPNIGYHTRLYENNTFKVFGGSFGGLLDTDTANRLVNTHFSVVIKNSGTAVFVDKEGREVSLYITVDASSTDKGIAAIKQWRKERYAREALEATERELHEGMINDLMEGLSYEEIVRRLSGNN